MYVIMGGTGHVGAALVEVLRERGESVTAITRHRHQCKEGKNGGSVDHITVDVNDVDALRQAFQLGRRAFLLNPPGDVQADSDALERQSVASILAALDGSGLEKVVAASTGGAQPGHRLGDLSVLWELEQGLARKSVPAATNRGAYYFSNWDAQIDSARQTGVLHTLFPAELEVPMVAPADLGKAAAERLVSGQEDVGVRLFEGPQRLTSQQVAQVFGAVLGRDIRLAVTARSDWEAGFRALGFSTEAACSYARMTAVCVDQGFDAPGEVVKCPTTLEAYLRDKVRMST